MNHVGRRYERSWHVYWINAVDPETGLEILAYIGETNRDPRVRFAEHMGDDTERHPGQPWADTVRVRDPDAALAAGVLVVSRQSYPSKRAAWLAERAAVYEGQPLYNFEHNLHNPNRVPIYQARLDRAARDRARGVPPHRSWVVLHERWCAARQPARRSGRFARLRWAAGVVLARWRRLPVRVRRRVTGFGVSWLLLALLLWLVAARHVPGIAAWRQLVLAGALAAAGLVRVGRRRRGGLVAVRKLVRVGMLAVAVLVLLPGLASMFDAAR